MAATILTCFYQQTFRRLAIDNGSEEGSEGAEEETEGEELGEKGEEGSKEEELKGKS